MMQPLLGLPRDLNQVWLPRDFISIPVDLCRKTVFVRTWAANRRVTRLAWLDDGVAGADRVALEHDRSGVNVRRDRRAAFTSAPPVAEALAIPWAPTVGLAGATVGSLLGRAVRA